MPDPSTVPAAPAPSASSPTASASAAESSSESSSAVRGLFDPATRLGRDYLALDWAATPLGEPDGWPGSLRNAVTLMLESRFAMWMAWGPQLTFFCNDSYRRDTLGKKYPWALGRPFAEVWSEIADEIAPLVERVTQRGESTWDEALMLFLERNGYPEETYHTFSYSPLRADDGAIRGLFCVVSEDTGRVVSERRITALSNLAAGLADTRTESDVYAATERVLAADPYDLPFAMGYELDGHDSHADLVWTVGIRSGNPVAAQRIDPDDPRHPWARAWPRERVSRTVEGIDELFTDLPSGAWAQPPTRALVVPTVRPGTQQATGVVVVGVSPHRPLDADYIGFLELVAGQIAAAAARTRALDDERRQAERAAELDHAKTTFFTNVSHELRTPLTLLLGPAEDALADPGHPLDEAQRARIEVVARNGERLLKLVNTLLDFSRLTAGDAQPHLEPTDLARATAEVAAMFDAAVERAGLQYRVEVEPLTHPVRVDREMWAKIVLNLVSNALKATFTGSITVRLAPAGDGARLSVTDTGVGIAPVDQERLFERFHRVAGASLRTHEGSGIGLALVAELAQLHGGTVSVDSTPGVGSTFTVTLPFGSALPAAGDEPGEVGGVDGRRIAAGYVAEAERWLATAQPATYRAGDEGGGAPDSRSQVLVVDDNADMRDYVTGLLAPDYAVRSAPDGVVALRLARADPPDLVLTDVMMPQLDGFGLLAQLRADPATAHIPVIMLSARSGDDAAVEGLEAGADDYLVKPFSQRELVARVRANLELDRVRGVVAELERHRGLLAQAEQLAQVGSFRYDIGGDRLEGTEQFHLLVAPGAAAPRRLADALAQVHPQDAERVRSVLQAGLRAGADLDVEFRVGTSSSGTSSSGSSSRTMWMRGTVGVDEHGATIARGTVQDITARRAAEQSARAAAAARDVAAREHAIAQELQASLLPADTFHADHLDIAGFYRAGVEGTQVGGDWYDVIELDAGRTALVLGDVMGRGVRAAAVMGQLRATVRAYARIEMSPDALLHLLDDAVRDISEQMIVTCVYAVYDPSDQTLSYANAGHLPPLLSVPGRPTRRLTAGGAPLGAGRAWGAPELVPLPTGAVLTMYTDGLIERRGGDLDAGIEATARLLDEVTARNPAPSVTDVPPALTGTLLEAGQDDDVAVLVARVSDRATTDRFDALDVHSELLAVGAARDFATARLRSWAVAEGTVDDVRLIVSELVTNAIVHGSAPVQLRVRLGGGRLLVEVHDSAVTTPQLRHSAPTDDHGRGLLIVSMLAERWGTRPTPGGKAVWCQLRLP